MFSKALKINNESIVQVFKFVLTGVLNTALDFVVLNGLIFSFGMGAHGELYGFFKAISFLVAVVNSYVLSRTWVFDGQKKTSRVEEGLLFFLVSGIGFVLNVAISTSLFFFISDHTMIPHAFSANIGALCGSLLVLVWNFFGYKLIVFKK